jgi:putative ABC transport system permease protein
MLADNVRYAARTLAHNRGFTAAAVACLALGIGATTAIFSVVNAVLLKPLPYRDSELLVRIYSEFPRFPNGGLRRFPVSPPEFLDLRRDAQSWQGIENWQLGGATLAGRSNSLRVTVGYVSGGLLRMLGVVPVMGRLISEADDKPGASLVATISYGLWQRAYGGDPNILGRDIRHDGNPCVVVGVMPRGFEFPPGEIDKPDLWVPSQIDPIRDNRRGNHRLALLGRLKDGVSFEQARDEMARLTNYYAEHRAPNQHVFNPETHTILIAGFHDEVVRTVRLAMLVLLGAVGFVLLISSVNVANLLLARAEGRRREIAIRKAIGAGLARLIGQFVVEGLLLSGIGAAFGLALAYGGMKLIVNLNAGSIPRAAEIGVDTTVLLFTVCVSVLTGVVFGLAPLMHLVGQNLHETLKASAGRTTAHEGANRFRAALVAAELALALILLIGTGLMIKAFWKLQAVEGGFDPSNVATMRVTLPEASYERAEVRAAFWNNVSERLASLPGLEAAAVTSGLPPVQPLVANDTQIEGFVPREGGPLQNIDYWTLVGPKYFRTLGIRLVEGRFFDERDGPSSPPAVVVNQTMAKTFWPGESAIGKRVKPGFRDDWRTIVGVVADTKNAGLDKPTGTELFFPSQQVPAFGQLSMLIVARGAQGHDAMEFVPSMSAAVRAADPSAAISAVRSMDDVVAAARSRPRFLAVLLTLFSAVSLTLAALGIYGVMSYSVAQRTTEIGIRMAMGARSVDVLGLIFRRGLLIGVVGTAAGAAGAFALTRVLRGLLFGVSAFDAATFALMAGALIAVTLLACYVPALRASRVDPMVALRYE